MKQEKQQAVYSQFLIKKNGKLQFKSAGARKMYKMWEDTIPEGSECELFYSPLGSIGSAAKLARVHIMARTLANDIGCTVDEVKQQAKQKAGFKNSNGYFSTGDMDDSQLDTMITTIRELGAFVGVVL